MSKYTRELFEIVYQWGKVGVVTDEKAPAYLDALKQVQKVKRFVDNHNSTYTDFELSLSAGYVDEEGHICNSQMGIQATFSIGMPVYTVDGVELGRLSIGLFKNLNYADRTTDGLEIPVEYWRIDGYKGKRQPIKTYHQLHQPNKAQNDQPTKHHSN